MLIADPQGEAEALASDGLLAPCTRHHPTLHEWYWYPCMHVYCETRGCGLQFLDRDFTCVSLLLCCSHPDQQAALQLQLCLLHRRRGRNCSLGFLYTGTACVYILDTKPLRCHVAEKQEIIIKKALQLFLNGQIDVWGLRTPFLFLEWIGMNAMLVFVLGAQGILAAFVNGWYYESPDNTLVSNVRLEVINFWRNIRT